jgi:hypothetical protein
VSLVRSEDFEWKLDQTGVGVGLSKGLAGSWTWILVQTLAAASSAESLCARMLKPPTAKCPTRPLFHPYRLKCVARPRRHLTLKQHQQNNSLRDVHNASEGVGGCYPAGHRFNWAWRLSAYQ